MLAPTSGSILRAAADQTHPGPRVAEATTLFDFLEQVGDAFDVYFTLEEAQPESFGRIRRQAQVPVNFVKPQSVPEAIQDITGFFATLDVIPSPCHGRIFHVIERLPATTSSDYALDRKIAPSHRSTPVKDALAEIERVDPRIRPLAARGVVPSPQPELSGALEVEEDPAAETSVRDWLSSCTPLWERPRVLWTAHATKSGGTLNWEVLFSTRGLKPQPSGAPPVAWWKGRVAFHYNVPSAESIDSAWAYLRTWEHDPIGANVRWSILFIGRYGEEKDLLGLIERTDWEWASVGTMRHRYPVIEALIASPRERASEIAIDGLQAVADSPELNARVGRLCYVLRERLGIEKAREAVASRRKAHGASIGLDRAIEVLKN